MRSGAPLRFLGSVLAVWTGVRVFILWPATTPLPMLDAATPAEAAVPSGVGSRPVLRFEKTRMGVVPARPDAGGHATVPSRQAELERSPEVARSVFGTPTGVSTVQRPAPIPRDPVTTTDVIPIIGPAVTSPLSSRSRLSVDAWLVTRPSGGDTLAFGQLGASQAGARVTYALDEGRRVALSARVSAPLRGSGSEAGLGIDVRPFRAPVHLLVEERFGLEGGGARPAATVIAGGSVALPARARVDAYGQGGAVWRRGGFVDGAAVLTRPVGEHGIVRLEAGGGAWGAAQRRVARLDLGPSVAIVAPAGGTFLRLQLDYRLRVAGRARPGSGPAVTLGSSF